MYKQRSYGVSKYLNYLAQKETEFYNNFCTDINKKATNYTTATKASANLSDLKTSNTKIRRKKIKFCLSKRMQKKKETVTYRATTPVNRIQDVYILPSGKDGSYFGSSIV